MLTHNNRRSVGQQIHSVLQNPRRLVLMLRSHRKLHKTCM
ncbi:rCG28485 [Rattus norvegicus]|uniref:RCG28485 n=1 Tax=Rattus norvegicus TaxID=10116 RepID=A6HWP7_RAT|nr:rCG28485 [Rattus norvegicus]